MATVRFITIDGHRHDITSTEIEHESRCDECGEFMAPYAEVLVNVTATIAGITKPPRLLDLHLKCVPAKLAKVAEAIRAGTL